jgi:iron complex transport system substrate-binding protein
VNHGHAEEIVPLDPDLVVAGTYTTPTTIALLRQAGVPVETFDVPETLAAVKAQIRRMAVLLQANPRGAAIISDMDRRLATVRHDTASGPRPTALVLDPNGFTLGRGTLMDELLDTAGLDNMAARLGVTGYGPLPLEIVATHPVDVLVLGSAGEGPPSLATVLLHHPVLAGRTGRTVVVPSRLWTCGGPGVVEAVERLHAAARAVRRERASQ